MSSSAASSSSSSLEAASPETSARAPETNQPKRALCVCVSVCSPLPAPVWLTCDVPSGAQRLFGGHNHEQAAPAPMQTVSERAQQTTRGACRNVARAANGRPLRNRLSIICVNRVASVVANMATRRRRRRRRRQNTAPALASLKAQSPKQNSNSDQLCDVQIPLALDAKGEDNCARFKRLPFDWSLAWRSTQTQTQTLLIHSDS